MNVIASLTVSHEYLNNTDSFHFIILPTVDSSTGHFTKYPFHTLIKIFYIKGDKIDDNNDNLKPSCKAKTFERTSIRI